MTLVVDFYKRYGRLPCNCHRHEFKDEQEPESIEKSIEKSIEIAWQLPPLRALEYLKKRAENLKITARWDELSAEAHDKAFTIAKVTTAELLQEFYNLVETAKSEGLSVSEFKQKVSEKGESLPELRKWLDDNNPHRLKIIYDTNLQFAYAKGKYQGLKLLAEQDIMKYWQYIPSTSSEPNPLHKQYYNKIFRADDPIWNKIYPPSRFGCKCSVRAISDREMQEKGYEILNGDEFLASLLENKDLLKEFEREQKSRLNPLKQWEPDTSKFVSGIRQQLDNLLKQRRN